MVVARAFLVFAFLVTLVAASSPPQPNLPPTWSATLSIRNISTGQEVFRSAYYANDPNIVRIDFYRYIAIYHYDQGLAYLINGTNDESSIRCNTVEIAETGGGHLFDFSKATYVSTSFYYGTVQDQWSSVYIKDVTGLVQADVWIDSFTSQLYLVRPVNEPGTEYVFMDFVAGAPLPGQMFNLPATIQCPQDPDISISASPSAFYQLLIS